MLKTPPRNHDIGNEPTPMFATATDIAIAEALRHQLEERYFGSPDPHASLPAHSDEVH